MLNKSTILMVPLILVCSWIGFGSCQQHAVELMLDGWYLDTIPPVVLDVSTLNETSVQITFDKAIHTNEAENAANYSISYNEDTFLSVTKATYSNTNMIRLTTAVQFPGREYSLHIVNLRGLGKNPIPKQGYTFSFFGYGELPDTSVPAIIRPADGKQVDMDVTLFWEHKSGASYYELQISMDSTFETEVETIVVEAPATQYTFTASDAHTHYYTIKADVTEGDAPIHWFEPLDAIYVWGDSYGDEQKGTKNKPFYSIQDGIKAGKQLGKPVRVAAVEEQYYETLSIIEGVHVYGGYRADDSWETQNITANETRIQSTNAVTIGMANIEQPTIIQGLTISGRTTGTSYAVYVSQCTSNVWLDQNTIFGGDSNDQSIGVYIGNNSAIRLTNNTIHGGNPTLSGSDGYYLKSYALYCEDSTPTIDDNTLIGGTALSQLEIFTVYAKNSTPAFLNNTIIGGNWLGEMDCYVYTIYLDQVDGAIIQNNTISAGEIYYSSTSQAYPNNIAIVNSGDTDSILIDGNSIQPGIFQCENTWYEGIHVEYSNVEIQNNTFESMKESPDNLVEMVNDIRFIDSSTDHNLYVGNNIFQGGVTSGSYINETVIYAKEGNSIIIEKNEVRTISSDSGTTIGIHLFYNTLGTDAFIRNNAIQISKLDSGDAIGIYLDAMDAFVYNNTIHIVGSDGDAYLFGMKIDGQGSESMICNNTLINGVTNAPGVSYTMYVMGGMFSDCAPHIINNILASYGEGASSFGIYETDTRAQPAELRNNLIFHMPGSANTYLYCNAGGINIDDTETDLDIDNELINPTAVIPGTIDGNITFPTSVTDLTTIFNDPINADEDCWNDFQLLASNVAINQGVNLYNDPLYGEIVTDLLEVLRPELGSWEIGAYNFD